MYYLWQRDAQRRTVRVAGGCRVARPRCRPGAPALAAAYGVQLVGDLGDCDQNMLSFTT